MVFPETIQGPVDSVFICSGTYREGGTARPEARCLVADPGYEGVEGVGEGFDTLFQEIISYFIDIDADLVKVRHVLGRFFNGISQHCLRCTVIQKRVNSVHGQGVDRVPTD